MVLLNPAPSFRSALILGGARSGKSTFAQLLAEKTHSSRFYIATAEPYDDEMKKRIHHHQMERGEGWTTLEEPIRLPEIILEYSSPDNVLLVDCLTLWLSNLFGVSCSDFSRQVEKLQDALSKAKGPVILVSNEIGMGIVPENALARSFRDEQGRLNQKIAASCEVVVFIAAGLPLFLKQ